MGAFAKGRLGAIERSRPETILSCRCLRHERPSDGKGRAAAHAGSRYNKVKHVLLTGGAGLLGGELAGRLLDLGFGVTALVHRSRQIRRNDGREIPASSKSASCPSAGELHLLQGDISRPRLGLSQSTLSAIAENHNLLIHYAAATGFGLSDAVYRSVNVDGTAHVLEVARLGGMPLLHVSTAYVCGARSGTIQEQDLTLAHHFANGYEASKAAAEQRVRESGVAAAIARPSIVVGEWRSGRIRSFDTIYAAFRLIAEGRIRTMPAAAGASLDFVPLDHVAAGLIDLAVRIEAASGGTFHLVSGAPVPVETFRQAICERADFACPRFMPPERFDPAMLPRGERRLHRRISALYASYFDRDPRFDDSRFRALTGRSCPPTDLAFLRRLIDYAQQAGFLNSSAPADRAASSPERV